LAYFIILGPQKHLFSMKYGLCNLINFEVTMHFFLKIITYNGIEDFFTILGHDITSKVMTLKNIKVWKL